MSQLKKLERDQSFAVDEFNQKFISSEEPQYNNKKIDLEISDSMDIEPSSQTEDLGIHMKNLFFKILEILANGENPIPYIMSNSRRQFVFAIMIIIIGGLMLFLSNLMISS